MDYNGNSTTNVTTIDGSVGRLNCGFKAAVEAQSFRARAAAVLMLLTTLCLVNSGCGFSPSPTAATAINSPHVQLISPAVVSAGSGSFALAVYGSNFNGAQTVLWNGAAVNTTVTSSGRANALIPAASVSTAGIVSIAVRDSKTGDVSNTLTLIISQPAAPTALVSISISPNTVSVVSGSSQQFTTAITGTTNTGATWSATGGTISSTGLYTAPTTPGSYTVTATSVADSRASALANVSVNPGSGTQPLPHTVTLSWQASTSTITGYNVYRSATSGSGYARVTSAPDPTNSYVDSSVQSGQTYYYVVTTVDSTGTESGYSSQVSAVIPTP